MWADLPLPWQACFELAWEAYREDCIPIGALVTDAEGRLLSRGRNRVYPRRTWSGDRALGVEIAHAEVEALRQLDYSRIDPHACILYTSTEPCPMCMGTFYMSGVRTLHFAARDPFAGSVNLLGRTWYLSRKKTRVSGPVPSLESIFTALFAEQELHFHNGKFPEGLFWDRYQETIPEGVRLGLVVACAGTLRDLSQRGAAAEEVFENLSSQVK